MQPKPTVGSGTVVKVKRAAYKGVVDGEAFNSLKSNINLLGWAMALGSFQCRDVFLLWHTVGQGPAVLAAAAGWEGCFFIFFMSSSLSPFSNASSLWRWPDIQNYCGLGRYNPTVVVSYYWRRAH